MSEVDVLVLSIVVYFNRDFTRRRKSISSNRLCSWSVKAYNNGVIILFETLIIYRRHKQELEYVSVVQRSFHTRENGDLRNIQIFINVC